MKKTNLSAVADTKMKSKKSDLRKLVQQADAAKKVNPLDLSSDQDLTIALMNLVSIEEHFVFSGAKTQKNEYYDLINVVRDIRTELMSRVVKSSGGDDVVLCVSKHLLAASMRLIEVGTKTLSAGDNNKAYSLFNKAYDLYSLFWGINMGLVDLDGVHKIAPDVYECAVKTCPKCDGLQIKKTTTQKNKSMVKHLGDWVKNAVNCCIE